MIFWNEWFNVHRNAYFWIHLDWFHWLGNSIFLLFFTPRLRFWVIGFFVHQSIVLILEKEIIGLSSLVFLELGRRTIHWVQSESKILVYIFLIWTVFTIGFSSRISHQMHFICFFLGCISTMPNLWNHPFRKKIFSV